MNVANDVLTAWREMADRRGVTQTEMLRNMILREKMLDDTVVNGGRVFIKTRDGKVAQLIWDLIVH